MDYSSKQNAMDNVDLIKIKINATFTNIFDYKNITSAMSETATGLQRNDYPLWLLIIIGILLAALMLSTTVGNCFVIIAVWKEKSLQTLTNKLVASLAVTDLLVGLIVMPLQAVKSIMGFWPFGQVVCNLFITSDVLFCTSSILHLVAIAVDRHWAITDVTYNKGSKLHKYMVPVLITGCWVLSAAICLPPFFGWKTEQVEGDCLISQDKSYTIYSTVLAFYLPLIIIIGIYIRIFFVVRARVRRRAFKKHELRSPTLQHPEVTASNTMVTIVTDDEDHHASTKVHSSPEHTNSDNDEDHQGHKLSLPQHKRGKRQSVQQILNSIPLLNSKKERTHQDKLAVKRERKAFRTLAIITGVFVSCWLPFFIVAISYPFLCPSTEPNIHCNIPIAAFDFVTWLGYVNCMLNPIIYNIFNPDFRTAFKKILQRRCRR